MSEFTRCLIVAGIGMIIGIKIGRDRETDKFYRAMAESLAECNFEKDKEKEEEEPN